MPRHRRLPDALARADHRERRRRKRLVARRLEAEVGAFIAKTGREHAAREEQALSRAEHRLVGEIDDDLGVGEPVVELGEQRHPVLRVATQLLRATGEPRADDVVGQACDCVPDNGRIVLSVDHHEGRSHRRDVTSPSIRAVYFSNSSVSIANWMIFSWPWNGYLRQTSTCVPENSITL